MDGLRGVVVLHHEKITRIDTYMCVKRIDKKETKKSYASAAKQSITGIHFDALKTLHQNKHSEQTLRDKGVREGV